MSRAVILTGGIYHPFAECAQAMAALLGDFGIDAIITEDVDEAAERLVDADLFVLYALRWRMLNDPKYQPFLAEWAFEASEATATRMESFVADGGALLAMHTASICFDTWSGYRRLLGGAWQWGTTFHPPLSRVNVAPVGEHPVVKGLAGFSMDDEIYHYLQREPASVPLLEGCVDGGDNQVVAWAHEYGAGRVIYDALGHDAATIEQPKHRAFLNASIEWLLPNLVQNGRGPR